MKLLQKPLLILLFVYLLLALLFFSLQSILKSWNVNHYVLLVGNTLLFAISILTLSLQLKSINNSNPNAFVRSIMGSMLIRMLVLGAGVIIYALAAGNQFSANSVFVLLLTYLIYLITEVSVVMKKNKKTNA